MLSVFIIIIKKLCFSDEDMSNNKNINGNKSSKIFLQSRPQGILITNYLIIVIYNVFILNLLTDHAIIQLDTFMGKKSLDARGKRLFNF